ncbi:MAG: hypothetical protein J5829_05065 [Lachnospiraceae bacterium]|nr:hypothetical protein [Lachnospiraceae bacterium]
MKKIKYTIVTLLTAVFILSLGIVAEAATKDCEYQGCSRSCVQGGRFCSYHTCIVNGCKGLRWSDKVPYCYEHRCNMKDCTSPHAAGSRYCSKHESAGKAAEAKMWEKYQKSSGSKKKSSAKSGSTVKKSSKSSSSSKKKYDPYDVYSYKSAQDFADDKYEEFYDYEDDYDDEDEAYDAAEDYWRDHHKK